MRVLLFDIDGTLIRSGGAGKLAMESALELAFGLTEFRDEVSYAGRTDRAIGHDLLTIHGIEASDDHRTRLHDAYLQVLPDALAQRPGCILPGVEALLQPLHSSEDVVIGLLTGNLRAGAEVKLRHFGLWNYFTFGGFGDAHHDRDDVAREAMRAAEVHLQRRIIPEDVWIIGDTPLDISCARAVGAKALAVATGWNTLDELAACRPDWLLPDLSSTASLLAAWRSFA